MPSKKPLPIVTKSEPVLPSLYAEHADLLARVVWAEGSSSSSSEDSPKEIAATLLGALCAEVKTLSALLRLIDPNEVNEVSGDLANLGFMIERRIEAIEDLGSFLAWSCRKHDRSMSATVAK